MRIGLACLALAAGLTGCGDEKLPAGKVTPEIRALLPHVPGDSRYIAGLDLALARSSGLWDLALADVVPKLVAAGHRCGVNLVNEIDRVIVSSPDQEITVKRVHLIVTGRFTESGKSCVNEIALLREANASWAGDVAIVTPSSLVPAASSVSASPEMAARIEKADTSGLAWAVADTRRGVQPSLPFPAEIHGIVLSVRPQGDGIAAVALLEVDSDDRARATANLVREAKATWKKALIDSRLADILGRVDVTQRDREVAFQVAVSRAELEHLLHKFLHIGDGP